MNTKKVELCKVTEEIRQILLDIELKALQEQGEDMLCGNSRHGLRKLREQEYRQAIAGRHYSRV